MKKFNIITWLLLLIFTFCGVGYSQEGKESQVFQYAQFPFTGAWLPDLDPASIGPTNYKTLQNFRYEDDSIVGVSGYSKINTTALTTYLKPRNGHHLRTNYDQDSYVLIQSENISLSASQVFQNQTAIGSQGNFEGTALHTDADGAGLGRFVSVGDDILYSNGVETMIWGGEESRCSAFFTCNDSDRTNPIDHTERVNNTLDDSSNIVSIGEQKFWLVFTPRPIQGVTYTVKTANTTASTTSAKVWNGSSFTAVSGFSDGTKPGTISLAQDGSMTFTSTVGTAVPFHFQDIYLYAYLFEIDDGTAEISFVTFDAPWQDLVDIWDGVKRQPIAFQVYRDSTGTFEDYTVQVNAASYETDPIGGILDGLSTSDYIVVMFEERISAIHHTLLGSLVNQNTATATVYYWKTTTGLWQNAGTVTDGTLSSGKMFGQTGLLSWNPPSETLETPREMFGKTGYVYKIVPSAALSGSTTKYVREDITFRASKYAVSDLTFSKTASPDTIVTAAGNFVVAGVRAGTEVEVEGTDSNNGVFTVAAVSAGQITLGEDVLGADEAAGDDVTLTRLGNPDTITTGAGDFIAAGIKAGVYVEVAGTDLNNGVYAVVSVTTKVITLASDVLGAFEAAGDTVVFEIDRDPDIVIDIVSGVPAQKTVNAYNFPSIYKNRLLLCGFDAGKQSNRVDYSVTNIPQALNGDESSMDGIQSLYFGTSEPLTCGIQLFNRHGSNIYSSWVGLKNNETYLLLGDGPDNFKINPVSLSVGCPAPLTLDTAEIGYEIATSVVRNIAVWLSYSGPVMFDGTTPSLIRGIDKFFDPTETDCINFDAIENARGWLDPTYKEYNLLIPSGSGATENNKWLVYDLVRQKWFEKATGTANIPQCAFRVMDEYGTQYVYGGVDNGHIMQLEDGTSWDGEPITQKVAIGDWWPTGNVWDKTRIRRLKVVSKRITEDYDLGLIYYTNSSMPEETIFAWTDTTGFVWTDTTGFAWTSAEETLVDFDLTTGTYRLSRDTESSDYLGWSHGFGFQLTSDDLVKGAQLISWGAEFQYVRKDT